MAGSDVVDFPSLATTSYRKGWICPVCARGVSPDQFTCDHGGAVAVPLPPSNPAPCNPLLPTPTPWPDTGNPLPATWGGCDACRLSGVCMCVRHNRVTCGQATSFTITADGGFKAE